MRFGFSRRSFITVALASVSLLLAACGDGGSQPAAGGGAKDPNRKLKLAFVTNNGDNFWAAAKAGVTKAAADISNIEVDFRVPQQANVEKQQSIVDDLLTSGVDGIAISPNNPDDQTQFLNKVAGKALLVTQDSDAAKSNRACYIGTDNRAAGVQAGELLKKTLPNGGKIVIFVGNLDAQNAKDRLAGIEEAIKGTAIVIADKRLDGTMREKAKSNAQEVLVSTPDVACLVGLYSYNGPSLLLAVNEAKKEGKVKIVCFDDDDATLAGIKSGTIEGTIVQQPYKFGYDAMTLMAKYLRGDKSVFPASKTIYVPTLAITKAEVEKYMTDLQNMRSAK